MAAARGLAEDDQPNDSGESHVHAHLLPVNATDGQAAQTPASFSALGAEALWGSGTGGAGAAVEALQVQHFEQQQQQLSMLGGMNGPRSSRSIHRRHVSMTNTWPSQPHVVEASTTKASRAMLTLRTSSPGASLFPGISQGVLNNSSDSSGGGRSSKQMTRQRAATDFQSAGLPRAATRSTAGPPTALHGQQGSLARAVQLDERQQSSAGRQSRLLGGSPQASALSETAAAVGLPATAAEWWRRQSFQAVQGVMGFVPEVVDEYEPIQTGQDSRLFMGSDTQPAAVDEGGAVLEPEDDLDMQRMLSSQQLVSGDGQYAGPPTFRQASLLTAAAVGRGSVLHPGLGDLGEAAGAADQADVHASPSFEEATAVKIGGLVSRPTLTTHATASAMPAPAAAAEATLEHENRRTPQGPAALPVLEDGSRLDEVAVALRGVQQSMVALQQQLLGVSFGPEDPGINQDNSRPGVAVRSSPDKAAKVSAVMDIADAKLSMQQQRHAQAVVKAAADVQPLAHRPSAAGAPGATRPQGRPPPPAPPLPTALAAGLGSKQGAGGTSSRPASSKPMAPPPPPLPPTAQLQAVSKSAAAVIRVEGGTRFAAQTRSALQSDLGSNASGDRGALLQAIQAGTKLKHIQRASKVPQQLQAQPLQQALNNRNASSPMAGPAEPANTALLKAVQSGNKLRHVQRASMMQESEQHVNMGGHGLMSNFTAASGESGRAALLKAIQAGANLHHVHRPSMVHMQQHHRQ
eukprot:gene10769-10925_t